MEVSKVYFTNLRTGTSTNLQQKLTKLVKKAGIANIDFENKYVAIKIHFGEPGNLAFLRPNYARTIADLVKELGGKPYLAASTASFGQTPIQRPQPTHLS